MTVDRTTSEDGGSEHSYGIVSPPSYTTLFAKEHESNRRLSEQNNVAVLLKVSRLQDDVEKSKQEQWSIASSNGELNHHQQGHHVLEGYGVLVTVLFIVGEMVGGGIISMPIAIYRQSWFGIAVVAIVGTLSGYTGIQLGHCWSILQSRWDQYRHHTQKPYVEIGYRAGGVWCKRFVSLCMNITLIGTATVFLIIAADNISALLENWFHFRLTSCIWALIVAAVILPVTYLGSPKDFWQVSLGAAGATFVAVIIMIIGMSSDYKKYHASDKHVTYPVKTLVDFILGYGTIMFAYSGQCAYPTIQHDMKQPQRFPKAILIAYALIFMYYLPVCILGYVVYGSELEHYDSILKALPEGWIMDSTKALITLHVIFGFVIFINPVNQELESVLRIPTHFTWKRLVLRTFTMLCIIFIAESVPSFDIILNLIGGTSMAFLTFVFPGAFYLMLRWNTTTNKHVFDTPIKKWEYPVNAVIIMIGVLGAIASVYASVSSIVAGHSTFRLPCYIDSNFNSSSV